MIVARNRSAIWTALMVAAAMMLAGCETAPKCVVTPNDLVECN